MSNLFIITGPCAAETEQQVLATAEGIATCRRLHPNYLYIYRAGVWKPRTSPDSFQGIGSVGLQWLLHVKQSYDLPVATEVATIEQTQQAIKTGIDYLWVGARTAANPIAVQEIADCIRNYKNRNAQCPIKAVLIKNPVNEDVALWMGNIERLKQTGVQVIAVHRGCNHRPCWKMAYELKHQESPTPLVIDPSHLSGRAEAVSELCERALQLGYQGWMIETHVSPALALSDAKQQITPQELEKLIDRMEKQNAQTIGNELDWLRCMIDEVDDDLWYTLEQRMDICRRIGAWKRESNVPVIQPVRYQQMLQKRIAWCKEKGLDEASVEQIMNAIHKESIRVQS